MFPIKYFASGVGLHIDPPLCCRFHIFSFFFTPYYSHNWWRFLLVLTAIVGTFRGKEDFQLRYTRGLIPTPAQWSACTQPLFLSDHFMTSASSCRSHCSSRPLKSFRNPLWCILWTEFFTRYCCLRAPPLFFFFYNFPLFLLQISSTLTTAMN